MAGPPPLNVLNASEVAARHKSFKKAAEELNVTPTAVSQQIRMLEEPMGVQLVHRLNRGLALTGVAGLPLCVCMLWTAPEACDSIEFH